MPLSAPLLLGSTDFDERTDSNVQRLVSPNQLSSKTGTIPAIGGISDIAFLSPPAQRSIIIDGRAHEVIYIQDIAVIERNGLPHRISFYGPPRNVVIDGIPHILGFGEILTVYIDNHPHTLRFGAPSRELYMGDFPFNGVFGGPPIIAHINAKRHEIQLSGPAPRVKVHPEPAYDLHRFMHQYRGQKQPAQTEVGSMVPSTTHSSKIAEFRLSLDRLESRDMDLFRNLTILAEESQSNSAEIITLLETKLYTAKCTMKLPYLQLTIFILNHLSNTPYRAEICKRIVEMFYNCYTYGDSHARKVLMDTRPLLRRTIQSRILNKIDQAIKRHDINWPLLVWAPKDGNKVLGIDVHGHISFLAKNSKHGYFTTDKGLCFFNVLDVKCAYERSGYVPHVVLNESFYFDVHETKEGRQAFNIFLDKDCVLSNKWDPNQESVWQINAHWTKPVNSNDYTISVGGQEYQVLFVQDTPVVEVNRLLFRLVPMGSHREVVVDGIHYRVKFGETRRVCRDNLSYSLSLGGPGGELCINSVPYKAEYGGPSILVSIQHSTKLVRLSGPTPEYRFESEPANDLLPYIPGGDRLASVERTLAPTTSLHLEKRKDACPQCGMRIDLKSDKYMQHMDWHAKGNLQMLENKTRFRLASEGLAHENDQPSSLS